MRLGLLSKSVLLALFAFAATAPPAALGEESSRAEEIKKPAYAKLSLSVGAPYDGFQVRPRKLHTAPFLRLLKKRSDAVFAQPALVLMLQRTAKQIAKSFPGSKLVVGDLSAKKGGSLTGHHSHQTGRDADVLFYARDEDGKMTLPTKFVVYGGDGKATDGSGLVFDDERNWRLVQAWAEDKHAGVKYIFVSNGLKARLIAFASAHPKYKDHVAAVAAVLMQPEDAEPHQDHFHVRIKCPAKEDKICVE